MNYIKGDNEKQLKFEKHLPVAQTFIMANKKAVRSSYLSFYLPGNTEPPSSRSKAAYIYNYKQEQGIVYTRAFGYTGAEPSKNLIEKQSGILAKALIKDGLSEKIHWNVRFIFGYSDPADKIKRMEVAFAGKSDDKETPTEDPKPLSEICKSVSNPNGSECAEFEEIGNTDMPNVEERLYKSANSVYTKIEMNIFGQPQYEEALDRLTKYINGNNKDGFTMEMVVPVTFTMDVDENYRPINQYVAYGIPKEVTNPPEPTDDKVILKRNTPIFNVYVRAFGGVVHSEKSEETYSRQFKMLLKDLIKGNAIPDNTAPQTLITLEYTSPEEGGLQRHEVAVPKPLLM